MDYADWYKTISQPFRSGSIPTVIRIADTVSVYLLAIGYLATLAILVFIADPRIVKTIAVPAVVFAAVSAVRVLASAPRPYEVYPIDPIIAKETQGKSMPSRHVASSAVIACTLLWLDSPIGLPAVIATCILAGTRIIGGVHFPRDILVAILVALTASAIGFLVIP